MSSISPEDYERIMLLADDVIKKSKGFMLSVINSKGDFQSISYFGDLDSMQQLGLIRAISRTMDVAEDAVIGTYSYNDSSAAGDDENASEGDGDDDGDLI